MEHSIIFARYLSTFIFGFGGTGDTLPELGIDHQAMETKKSKSDAAATARRTGFERPGQREFDGESEKQIRTTADDVTGSGEQAACVKKERDKTTSEQEPQQVEEKTDKTASEQDSQHIKKKTGKTPSDSQPRPSRKTKTTAIKRLKPVAPVKRFHPRASFLGLPVELRLLIYGFIPESKGNAINEAVKIPVSSNNTFVKCSLNHDRDLDIAWTGRCRDRVLDILRANKQIALEAMPILYRHVEVGPIFELVPTYARQYVRKVVIVCDHNRYLNWCVLAKGEKKGLGGMWACLARMFPQLVRVRLLFYPSSPTSASKMRWKELQRALSGITCIPKLEELVVGAHTQARRRQNFLMRATEEVCDQAVSHIKAEVLKAEKGGRVKVVKGVFGTEACLVCTKGAV